MSVARAQSEISSAEFSEWLAFHNLNPFTFKSEENMLSIICTILANVHKKAGGKAYKPADFLPQMRKPRESAKDIETKLRAMFP